MNIEPPAHKQTDPAKMPGQSSIPHPHAHPWPVAGRICPAHVERLHLRTLGDVLVYQHRLATSEHLHQAPNGHDMMDDMGDSFKPGRDVPQGWDHV